MELTDLYISLFLTFLKIGVFGFGGGYAMLPLIQQEVVDVHGWISVSDFTDIVAISQTTPGPIAFNSATYIGYTAVTEMGYAQGYGVIGSAICTLAVSLPSLVIMTIVCVFFFRLKSNPWMQASLSVLKPAIIGLIASAALMLMNGIVNLTTTLPSAPGYVGTFDAPGIALLVAYGIPGEIAAGYTLVLHAALWFPITLLGAYYYLRQPLRWGKDLSR